MKEIKSVAVAPAPTLASGFPALDAELPGAGWPRGALTELLTTRAGIGELSLLQPALRQCAAQGPVALVAPAVEQTLSPVRMVIAH
jgi:hypothetical protein